MKRAAYLAALLLMTCTSSQQEDPLVARAYNHELRLSDVRAIVPKGASAEDSLKTVTTYVNNWARKHAEIAQAELNLNEQQKDFDAQLEDYYNSLVIYAYENELIRQKLDTEVPEEEIHEHYLLNEKEFELKATIVKVRYLMASDLEKQERKLVERIFYSDEEGAASEARVICEQQGAGYFDSGDQWMPLSTLVEQLQWDYSGGDARLLEKEAYKIEVGDSLIYLHFVDYKLKNSLSPLSLERNRIREIILNQRKNELIAKMQKDLLERALKNGDILINE